MLAILDGLPEPALRTSMVPSGWTPLGLLEHLVGAEFFWIQVALLGKHEPMPIPDGAQPRDVMGPFVTERPVAEVIESYRGQCAENDVAVRDLPLGTAPRFPPPWVAEGEAADLRWILLHLIEETARHAGHLDIARELLDGRTGLGPR